MIRFQLPIRTQSEANVREHWAKRAKRTQAARAVVVLALRGPLRGLSWLEALRAQPEVKTRSNGILGAARALVRVELTRIAPRALDDDNLRGALKAVRDGVADVLGVDDRDPRVGWDYAQSRGKPNEYAVGIVIHRSDAVLWVDGLVANRA